MCFALRRCAVVLLMFVGLLCRAKVQDGEWTPGVTREGPPAITRTTADINKASAEHDADAKEHGKKFRTFLRPTRVEVPEFNESISTNTDLPPPSYQLNPAIATPTI